MNSVEIEAIRESAEYHMKTGVSRHGYYSHDTVLRLAELALEAAYSRQAVKHVGAIYNYVDKTWGKV